MDKSPLFLQVEMLVRMEGRGLKFDEVTVDMQPTVDRMVTEEWIVSDETSGYVMTILGMERLAGFRALLAPVDDYEDRY